MIELPKFEPWLKLLIANTGIYSPIRYKLTDCIINIIEIIIKKGIKKIFLYEKKDSNNNINWKIVKK